MKKYREDSEQLVSSKFYRDCGATLRLGGGGTISDSILGGGTKHFFLLILYNFKNIGGGGTPAVPGLLWVLLHFNNLVVNYRIFLQPAKDIPTYLYVYIRPTDPTFLKFAKNNNSRNG